MDETVPDPVRWVLRRWWIVLLLAVLGALAGAGYASTLTKQYDATATVLVQQTPGNGGVAAAAGATPGGIDMVTEAQVAAGDITARAAQSLLKTTTSPADLESAVSVSSPANSAVLTITFTASTPKGALDGATAFAQAYLNQRAARAQRQLQQQVAQLQQQQAQLTATLSDLSAKSAASPPNSAQKQQADSSLQVVSQEVTALAARLSPLTATTVAAGTVLTPAALPTSASSPNILIDIAAGLVLGLVLGVGLALLRGRADHRVRSVQDLERALGSVVVLAVAVPRTGRLLSGGDLAAHSFGLLRALLGTAATASAGPTDGHVRVVLTGLRNGGATSHLTANLAAASARAGHRTLLVAADPQSDSLTLLGATSLDTGLSALLTGQRVPAAERTSSGVYVLPAGPAVPERDLLASAETLRYLQGLEEAYDVMLVETPPPAVSTGSQSLAADGGAVLVVVERGRDRLDGVTTLATEVQQVGGSLLGVVLVHERSARQDRPAKEPATRPSERDGEAVSPQPAGSVSGR